MWALAIDVTHSAFGARGTTGQGEKGVTTIVFPTQNARFIRIIQTGSAPTYNWSISEVDVYRKKAR